LRKLLDNIVAHAAVSSILLKMGAHKHKTESGLLRAKGS